MKRDLEWQLLLACARPSVWPIDAERIVNLCSEPLDWRRFLGLVARHRVAPIIWRGLQGSGAGSIPESVQGALRQQVNRNSLKALAQTAALVRLVRRFEDAGVRMLPLKGPGLAIQAFGALELRHVGHDLDLLVDPDSVGEADRVLKEAGYLRTSPGYPLSRGQTAAFMKIRKDFTYNQPDSDFHIELHWRWSQNACLLPLTVDDLWPRREFVKLANTSVPAMPRQELVLYLCAHGAHTGWFRLKWLCDLAALTAGDDAIDGSELLERAEELGVTRMLVQGLVLGHQMLDVPLPDYLPEALGQDRAVESLVSFASQSLVEDERNWSTDDTPISWMPAQLRYRLELRRDLRYKWHNFYFHSLWTDKCRRIRLPERLFPFYFFIALLIWPFSQLRRSPAGTLGR